MDEIYHPSNCGEECPICRPEVQSLYVESRWREWESFPGWEFRGERGGKRGVIVLARPKNVLTNATRGE